jgi:hypothetical protein
MSYALAFSVMSIAENLAEVRQRIESAARRAGRDPKEIALMAVSKTFPSEKVREAFAAGQRLFGENRVQELAGKVESLSDLSAEWHLIGHLQTNKARKAAELNIAIDSVDSLRLAEKLHASGQQLNQKTPILLEINIGGEDAKSGLAPESPELEQLLQAAPQFDHLEIHGLMAIPPFTDDPEGARPYFRRMQELRRKIAARKLAAVAMDTLSMGMSHDFEVAIEEGSTCVRVGTAIFGERKKAV